LEADAPRRGAQTLRREDGRDQIIRSICGVLGLDAEEMMAKKYLASIPRELWSRVARLIEE